MSKKIAKHWSQKPESGAYWGMFFMLWSYRLLGKHIIKIFLFPVMCYFFIVNSSARKASYKYLSKVHNVTGKNPPTIIDRFGHFWAFGNSLIDRLGAWTGQVKRSHVVFEKRQLLFDMIDNNKGAVLITAHLGNIEMCRALAENTRQLKINVLVYTHHSPSFNRLLKNINKNESVNLIQLTEISPNTIELLENKIDAGELVIIAADRTSANSPDRVCRVNFLGEEANFPQGPFILSSLLKCPVALLFCIKRNGRHEIQLEPFANPLELPRRERKQCIHNTVEKFVLRVEHYCKISPNQWFNFFDFWKK